MDEDKLKFLFSTNLRSLRKKRGMTQEILAKAAGMTRQAVTNIETQRHGVTLETIYALAGALNVEPRELLPELAPVPRRPIKANIPLTKEVEEWIHKIIAQAPRSTG